MLDIRGRLSVKQTLLLDCKLVHSSYTFYVNNLDLLVSSSVNQRAERLGVISCYKTTNFTEPARNTTREIAGDLAKSHILRVVGETVLVVADSGQAWSCWGQPGRCIHGEGALR